MLINLEKEMRIKKIKKVEIADLLECRYQTVSDKISGKSDFKVNEALKIRECFFPEYRMKYLFESVK